MKEYHKIQSVWKRDPANNNKTFIEGDWSMPEFGYLANNQWTFTEKVDGTNIRVMVPGVGQQIKFGGKTDDAQIPAILVEKLQARFLPQSAALNEMFSEGGCLYGEGYGAKIQKGGGNYRPDQDFVLFDVRVGDWWLTREAVEDVASKLGLDVVPIIGAGTLADMVDMARKGFQSRWGAFSFLAEGIVARPCVELFARNRDRIITKVKHKDFTP